MNKILTGLLAAALLAPVASAHGDGADKKRGDGDKKPGGGGFAACEADKAKLCGGVEPGDGRLIACVMEHEAELSEGCRAAVKNKKSEEARQKKKSAGQLACEADIKRLCANIEPGEGRIIACMAAHEADLSKDCRPFMGKKKEGENGREKKDKKPKQVREPEGEKPS